MDLLLKIYIYENVVLVSRKEIARNRVSLKLLTDIANNRTTIISIFSFFFSFIPRSYSWKSLELWLSPEITICTSYLPDSVSNFSETRLKCALFPFDILL